MSWLIALGFIFLVVGAGMILRFWKYIIYLPPLWERLIALPAESPATAYEKFQNELLKGNDKKSLRFITREEFVNNIVNYFKTQKLESTISRP